MKITRTYTVVLEESEAQLLDGVLQRVDKNARSLDITQPELQLALDLSEGLRD